MANVGNPERVRWHHLAHSGANQNTGFASYTLTGYQERPGQVISSEGVQITIGSPKQISIDKI